MIADAFITKSVVQEKRKQISRRTINVQDVHMAEIIHIVFHA